MTITKPTLSSQSSLTKENRLKLFEITLTLTVFIVLVLYAYSNLFLEPNLGFNINLNTGDVTSVDPSTGVDLQVNDVILSVNGVLIQKISHAVRDNPLVQTKEGDFLNLRVRRGEDEFDVQIKKPYHSEKRIIESLSGDWILSLPFFAAGLITMLFIRPRTKTRKLLILFFYFFAIWIGAGTISNTGYWYSSLTMRLFIWLSLPVSFQLHWNFPRPFNYQKKWINFLGYGVVAGIIICDFLGLLPPNSFFIGFLFTILSSFFMLIVKLIRFIDIRKLMQSLISAYILAIFPLVIMAVLSITGNVPASANMALLGLTAIPGFYFFTGYQIHLNRRIRNITLAMRFYVIGILVEFILFFIIPILPPNLIQPTVINFISFLIIIFIIVTGFGILLLIPALANDQTNLFPTETYTLRLSANRSAAFVNYLLFLAPISLLVLLGFSGADNQSFSKTLTFMLIVMVFVGISVLIYPKYRKFFDRMILGIKHPPEELIRNFIHRITTSLDIDTLAMLLTKEVLPSLLIRESALFYFEGRTVVNKLFAMGVSIEHQDLIDCLGDSVTIFNEDNQNKLQQAFPWLSLILPLQIETETLGIWMFGRKDPDEIYNQDLIKDLKALGNQTTLALLNIRQGALLQSLYKSNVDRQEDQKASVARDLHDVLLPSIGFLVELQSNNCDPFEFEVAVQRINNMVRGIMSGLRPSSLDMGLFIALEDLADEPEAQIGGKINIHTDLKTPTTPIYYDKGIELHLYRMVQQACRNALEHAQANAILIKGTLTENIVDLTIEDDGIGFPFDEMPDLGQLIINHHFGLANIVERAKIIHAEVNIDSNHNKGTKLHFYWPSQKNSE